MTYVKKYLEYNIEAIVMQRTALACLLFGD